MTAEYLLTTLWPGMLGPYIFPDLGTPPRQPGVVIVVERRCDQSRPIEVLESLDIAETLADRVLADDRYAYALVFSDAVDPRGTWRRSVTDTVRRQLCDARWHEVEARALRMVV